MATNTNESVVFQGLSGLIRNNVLGPIVQYLSTRQPMQGQITVDELANILRLPASNSVPQPIQPIQTPIQQPFGIQPATSMPGIFGLNGLAGSQPLGAKKTKAPSEPIPTDQRCQYLMQRGRDTGKQCDKRAVSGSIFCTACSGKKAAQAQVAKTGGMAPMGGMPMMPGQNPMMPGIMGQAPGMNPAMSAQLTTTQAPQSSQLQVVSLGNGHFLSPVHGLLFRNGANPHDIICVGTFDQATRQSSHLTPEKIQLCQSLGVTYVEPGKQTANPGSQVSTLPSVSPASSQNNGMPNLPSVTGQMPNLPSVTGQMPNLPSVTGQPSQQQFNQQLPSSMPQQLPSSMPQQQLPSSMPQQLPSSMPQQQFNQQQLPSSMPQQQFNQQQLPSSMPQQQFNQQLPSSMPQQQFNQQLPSSMPQQFPQQQFPQGLPSIVGQPSKAPIGVATSIPSVMDIPSTHPSDPVEDDEEDEDNNDDTN